MQKYLCNTIYYILPLNVYSLIIPLVMVYVEHGIYVKMLFINLLAVYYTVTYYVTII